MKAIRWMKLDWISKNSRVSAPIIDRQLQRSISDENNYENWATDQMKALTQKSTLTYEVLWSSTQLSSRIGSRREKGDNLLCTCFVAITPPVAQGSKGTSPLVWLLNLKFSVQADDRRKQMNISSPKKTDEYFFATRSLRNKSSSTLDDRKIAPAMNFNTFLNLLEARCVVV